jgi:predicted DNA-binding transcriptional regulator AlpA
MSMEFRTTSPAPLLRLDAPMAANSEVPGSGSWLLSIRHLAELLELSIRSVHRMNSAGRLPRPVRLGGSVRWRRDEVVRWIAAGCPSRHAWEAIGGPAQGATEGPRGCGR